MLTMKHADDRAIANFHDQAVPQALMRQVEPEVVQFVGIGLQVEGEVLASFEGDVFAVGGPDHAKFSALPPAWG